MPNSHRRCPGPWDGDEERPGTAPGLPPPIIKSYCWAVLLLRAESSVLPLELELPLWRLFPWLVVVPTLLDVPFEAIAVVSWPRALAPAVVSVLALPLTPVEEVSAFAP